MEGAISKFMEGLEGQERSGFPQIHRLLSRLPVPVQKKTRSMTHSEALEGRYLPNMSEEEQKRFTPSELIPHMFGKRKEAGFPFGCADAAALDGRRGSNIYEVNPWLWQFGRGKPRLGGLSIEQTGERKHVASDARHKRAAETKRARKTA
jgi:hypothetical protein